MFVDGVVSPDSRMRKWMIVIGARRSQFAARQEGEQAIEKIQHVITEGWYITVLHTHMEDRAL